MTIADLVSRFMGIIGAPRPGAHTTVVRSEGQ
jgi:hypothetical protein